MHWLYRTCHMKLSPFFLPTLMCSENWGKNHILKKVWQGGITIIIIGLIPIGKINFQEKLVKFRQKFPKNSVFSPEAPIGTTGEYFNSNSIKFRPKSSSFFQKISSIFLRADIFVLPCRSKVVKFYYKYIVIFQKNFACG